MAKDSLKNKVRRGKTFAKRTATSSKISKRIGWLNSNAGLATDITYTEVKDLLNQAGDDEAMRILKDLEQRSQSIRDPTAYLVTAALNSAAGLQGPTRGANKRQAGAKKRRATPAAAEEAVASAEELETRVQWLNLNAGLLQELHLEEVVGPLSGLSKRDAMDIFKRLEQRAPEVGDPTGYVVTAARNRGQAADESSSVASKKKVLKSGLKSKTPVKAPGKASEVGEKVLQRITWLNGNAGLNGELDAKRLGPLLAKSGSKQDIMNILKTLEESAAEVRDPNAFVAKAAGRLAKAGGLVAIPSGNRKAQAQAHDLRDEPLEKQLRAQISWLNKAVHLNAPLRFDQVAPLLLQLQPAEVGEILRRLEDSAQEVRDPTGYVVAGARKFLKQSSTPSFGLADDLDEGEAKIQRRLEWLNNNVCRGDLLEFDRVAPSLLQLSMPEAMEVLKAFEENSATVRNPNAYVTAGARKAAGVGAGGREVPGIAALADARTRAGSRGGNLEASVSPRDGNATYYGASSSSAGSAAPKGALRRRVDWLNANGGFQAELDVDQVLPQLLRLTEEDAMEILRRLEDSAGSVREPTAYVISSIRRAVDGGNGRNNNNNNNNKNKNKNKNKQRGRVK